MTVQEEIRSLAAEKNAVILAHNYQWPEVQDAADFVGDSLGLSLEAQKTTADLIVFCGVHFMAESAKVLNPQKRVLLPNLAAGCSLADSITAASLLEWRERYPDHTVVTYVNSTAEVKALSDICCTSANAVSVVRSLENDKILFTPDRNLGRWVADQVPEKQVVVYDGVCPIHDIMRGADMRKTIDASTDADRRGTPGVPRGRSRSRPRDLFDDGDARAFRRSTRTRRRSSSRPRTGSSTSCASDTPIESSSSPTDASAAASIAHT